MNRLAALLVALSLAFGADAAPRSRAVRAEFVRLNACPATGLHKLPCAGWQIDHKEALVCGGVDAVGNLQWLPIAEHKAKTRVEVKLCRAR